VFFSTKSRPFCNCKIEKKKKNLKIRPLGDGHICVESVCKIRNRSVAYSLSSDGHRLWKQHFEKNAFKVLHTFIRVWDENFSFFFCYLHRVVDSRPVFKCSRRNCDVQRIFLCLPSSYSFFFSRYCSLLIGSFHAFVKKSYLRQFFTKWLEILTQYSWDFVLSNKKIKIFDDF